MNKKTKTTGDLDRPVIIYIYKGGAIDFKHKHDNAKNLDGALPIFSVDSEADAEQLQTSFCKLSRDDNKTMVLPFSGKYEHMEKVTDMLRACYALRKAGVTGAAFWEPFVAYRKECGLEEVYPAAE